MTFLNLKITNWKKESRKEIFFETVTVSDENCVMALRCDGPVASDLLSNHNTRS